MTSTPAVLRSTARDSGSPTLIFIHGFLDSAQVWNGVVTALGDSVHTIRYELPGSGARAGSVADPGELSLELFAGEVTGLLDQAAEPIILVGQSMGTQVAELVAAANPAKVTGIVLVTPVPLPGTALPEEMVGGFRALGGAVERQRQARRQISPRLTEDHLDVLDESGRVVLPAVAARYVSIWNDGHPGAGERSAYPGPALIIRGELDGFVGEDLAEAVRRRFDGADMETVEGGGHWLHVEHPGWLARAIRDFAAKATAGDGSRSWRAGFADRSESNFADGFADEVVLEASVLREPIRGKRNVAAAMQAASSIYESLVFTAETTSDSFTYLQWSAVAFGGMKFNGITVLERDGAGKIVKAAIHKRPLAAILRFSAELRTRLDGVIPADHFHHGPADS